MKCFDLVFLLSFGVVTGVTGGSAPTKEITTTEVIKSTFSYAPEFRSKGQPHFTSDIYFSQSYFEHSSYEYDPCFATEKEKLNWSARKASSSRHNMDR